MALSHMGEHHPILEGLNKIKKAENSLCLDCGIHLLPLDIGAPASQTLRLGLNYTASFPGSLAHKQQVMRLSFLRCVS
jgi:hypothetical protein